MVIFTVIGTRLKMIGEKIKCKGIKVMRSQAMNFRFIATATASAILDINESEI